VNYLGAVALIGHHVVVDSSHPVVVFVLSVNPIIAQEVSELPDFIFVVRISSSVVRHGRGIGGASGFCVSWANRKGCIKNMGNILPSHILHIHSPALGKDHKWSRWRWRTGTRIRHEVSRGDFSIPIIDFTAAKLVGSIVRRP